MQVDAHIAQQQHAFYAANGGIQLLNGLGPSDFLASETSDQFFCPRKLYFTVTDLPCQLSFLYLCLLEACF
eukprot:scaffold2645_cov378-Prasinococcus_capsulatus_cf.AAC.21